ncbi:aspartate aminotransferase, partial [Staphylococcus aureus]|nr:aspartate aminotransferase [Staphylococcus aureus]
MNPLAQNLNNQLVDDCPEILSMLSTLGQSMYYPKGILSQSADAKKTK